MDMIERVAAAIATLASDTALRWNLTEINQGDKFENWRALFPIKVSDHDRALARAAIEAMREPTDAQRNAYYELSYKTETMNDAHWERAIDAALKVPSPKIGTPDTTADPAKSRNIPRA